MLQNNSSKLEAAHLDQMHRNVWMPTLNGIREDDLPLSDQIGFAIKRALKELSVFRALVVK